MESLVKAQTTPHFTLEIDTDDGATEPKVWKLCPDYRAIAKIENTIKRDIKRVEDWNGLSSGKDFPVIVWGLLNRYNPEVTLDEVLDVLNPQAQALLGDAIFNVMFPGFIEAFKKQQEADAMGATADPNLQTGTPNS
jgi:hypothetical protein